MAGVDQEPSIIQVEHHRISQPPPLPQLASAFGRIGSGIHEKSQNLQVSSRKNIYKPQENELLFLIQRFARCNIGNRVTKSFEFFSLMSTHCGLSSLRHQGDKSFVVLEVLDAKTRLLRLDLLQSFKEIFQPSIATPFQRWRKDQRKQLGSRSSGNGIRERPAFAAVRA